MTPRWILAPRKPTTGFQSIPPRFLLPGRPILPDHLPADQVPPAAVPNTLPLWAFIYYTYDQGNPLNWSAASMLGSPTGKGWLWQVWRDAIEARILARGGVVEDEIVETGSSLRFNGEALLDLASMMDVVVLGHDPPFEHIQAIKSRSTAPNGTKVILGFHNFESINQAIQWQPKWNGPRDMLKQYYVVGDPGSGCDLASLNSYGCDCIDQFEINDSSGVPGFAILDLCTGTPVYPPGYVSCPPVNATNSETKHSWDIDVHRATNSGNPASPRMVAFWDSFAGVGDTAPGSGGYSPRPWGFDGWLFDNLKGNPFKGSSTLDYPPGYSAQYSQGWTAFLLSFQAYFGIGGAGDGAFSDPDLSLWCNYGSSVVNYPRESIRNRFSEHAFRSGPTGTSPIAWTEIESNLVLQAQHGHRVVLGQVTTTGNAHYWYTTTGGANPVTNGTWARIVAKARELEITDLVYAQAVRTVSGSYIAFQEGWREPS